MRRAPLFVLISVLVWLGSSGGFAQQRPSVLVAKVDGSIDKTLASYLEGAVEDAEDAGSTLVVQLDSAGTLDQDAVALAQRLHDATVPVIVWVGPSPAKAQGAGLLFLYAASLGAVAPGVGVGALELLVNATAATEISTGDVQDLATGWVIERGRQTPVAFPERPVPAAAAIQGHIASVAAASI